MTIGERIKFMRVLWGLGQHAISDVTGVQQSKIAKYELGKQVPTFRVLERFASALNCNIEWLFEGKGKPFDFCYCQLPPRDRDPQRAGARSGEDLRQLLPLFLEETGVIEYQVAKAAGTGEALYIFGLQAGYVLVIKALDGFSSHVSYALSKFQEALEITVDQKDFNALLGEDIERSAVQLRNILSAISLEPADSAIQDYLAEARLRERKKHWKFRMILSVENADGMTELKAMQLIEEVLLSNNIGYTYDRTK